MKTKLGKVQTNLERLTPLKSHDSLILWPMLGHVTIWKLWLTDDVLQSETPTLKPHNLLITWSTQGRMTSWKIYICTFARLVGTRLGMVLTSGRSFSNEALQLSPAFSLREKCLNTEFFLVYIFPNLDWIRRDTSYLSVFSPNAGKYRPEKNPYLDTFHAVLVWF